MKKFLLVTAILCVALMGVRADGFHFSYDAGAYHSSTIIHAKLVDTEGNDCGSEYVWIGAFIDGECRGEVGGQMTNDFSTHFPLRVYGDEVADVGKPITFKVYFHEFPEGNEYTLPSSISVPFEDEGTVGSPLNPYLITIAAAESISLPQTITLAKGSQVDMMDYLTIEPENTILPVLTWDWQNASQYFTMEGTVLTAKNVTSEEGALLQVHDALHELAATTRIKIIEMASNAYWKDEYANGLTVAVGDYKTLTDVLDDGYIVEPEGASLSFDWESSDENIVKKKMMQTIMWEPIAAGTAIMTGVARDGSGITLHLVVTVEMPVTSIYFDGRNLAFEVNTDITDMLDELVIVSPDNATNKNYHYKIDDIYNDYARVENGRVVTLKKTDSDVGFITVRAIADDGYGANGSLDFHIINKQPKMLTAVSDPLSLFVAQNETDYCTETLIANLSITPEGLDVHDFSPSFTFSNENVIKAITVGQKTEYQVVGEGETTVTATVLSFNSIKDNYEELSIDFQVIAREELRSFDLYVSNTHPGGKTYAEVKPVPENAIYDLSKINITYTLDNIDLPEGWQFADAAFKETFDDGRNFYHIFEGMAYCVGSGRAHLYYDGEEYASAAFAVNEVHSTSYGWQWVSVYSGSLDLEEGLGINLKEARSQDEIRFRDQDDSHYYFFGNLKTFEPSHSYKLKIDMGQKDGSFFVNTSDQYWELNRNEGMIGFGTRKGWNWLTPPYQYYHSLQGDEELFVNTTFTTGDIIYAKDAFATCDGTKWTGSLHYLKPGEGVLFYLNEANEIMFYNEHGMAQQLTPPATARAAETTYPALYSVQAPERFDDNMSMIAAVCGVTDNHNCQVWAFVDGECRGIGETIGDRVFITVHGNMGEKATFRVLDSLTGQLYETYGTCTLSQLSGTMKAPVCLITTSPTAIGDATAYTETTSILTDAGGKVLYESPTACMKQLSLPHGIYMLTTTLPSGQMVTKKIVR